MSCRSAAPRSAAASTRRTGFGAAVAEELARLTDLPLTEARDHFEAQASQDGVVEVSGQLRTVAVALFKIANDVRWLGSGPRTGLGELALPDLQPGSSIMPGKVNPVISEATMMVVAQVIGNDAAVAFAGTQGNFQLNVMLPVIARNVLESARLLSAVARLLADKVFDGVEANVDRMRELAESSPSIVTPLNRYLGYEEAASIAKQSLKERKTIREVVLERGHVDERQAHRGSAGRGPRRAAHGPRRLSEAESTAGGDERARRRPRPASAAGGRAAPR